MLTLEKPASVPDRPASPFAGTETRFDDLISGFDEVEPGFDNLVSRFDELEPGFDNLVSDLTR